jgi:L-arabinokinase
MPTAEATLVALQKDADRVVRLVSLGADRNDRAPDFEMPLSDFERGDGPIGYAEARDYFRRDPTRHWAAYAAGTLLVLMRERRVRFDRGVRMLIGSDVPEGAGVSSSAALEVAAMQAVAAAFGVALDPPETALLCQKVENLVVGAPCGVMDQMTAACGLGDRLLALLCQPARLEGMVGVPAELRLWGVDSGLRHCVAGADYGSVRVGAFMGYRMIADLAGLSVEPGEPVRIDDEVWGGYLANVGPDRFEKEFADELPERISGRAFLGRYGGTTDPVTQVQPDREYAVRVPTAHPIYEHARVQRFAELLAVPVNETRLIELGQLMYSSHASYSACGLGSEGTDLLVELVRQAGPKEGLYGAKITGGGSGGTVAVLARCGADQAVQAVAGRYARQTGRPKRIFAGSSLGAAAFGHSVLQAM